VEILRTATKCVFAFLLCSFPFSCVHAQDKIIQTTVCEVTTHPEKFRNKRIRVRAEVWSDGIEHTVLVDDKTSCKLGLGITLSTQAQERDVFSPIHNAIFQGTIGSGSGRKRIFAVFVGVFTAHREIPTRVLSIESVSAVQVDLRETERP
jgi:hypothetical protein